MIKLLLVDTDMKIVKEQRYSHVCDIQACCCVFSNKLQ